MAANVDIVCVVTDADTDFNLRRMERYFTLIGRSQAKAIVMVNKADLFPDEQNQEAAEAIRAIATRHRPRHQCRRWPERRGNRRASHPWGFHHLRGLQRCRKIIPH